MRRWLVLILKDHQPTAKFKALLTRRKLMNKNTKSDYGSEY